MESKSVSLDRHMRLRLADLDSEAFERFFLHFLNSGISLEIERGGSRVERRIIEANMYAAGSGRSQKGVDLIAKVAGGETWVFQCKRHKTWSPSQTEAAIAKATDFPAQHYFLLVACDPQEGVEEVIAKHPNWSFWNLDRICAEFRLRVPKNKQPQVLHFLRPEELQRFAPYATDTFISPADYFASLNRASHSFHHRHTLVGRIRELETLKEFAAGPHKVLLISAKGGDGKSRLLWEFAESFAKDNPGTEVSFLNPHSSGSVPVALWDKETPRLLLVDDAHRLERVSNDLLTCVREGTATKLVLATRPQGNEVLEERLREHGLWGGAPIISLSALKKKDLHQLAEETLGPKLRSQVDTLLARTGDSPFLTALAGDLLQRGQLTWDNWSSDQEFRAAVFRSFEKDNLSHLAPVDQKHGARLLRVIALLAPMTPDGVFLANSAACLGISRIDAETLLQRLQAAGVVSGENRNVRVIPDLFSDFLVFDTAFDPTHRLPELARAVLASFADQSAALLRNLAEASWIADTEAMNRDDLLRPLLDAEFARFDGLGFLERSQMLQQWAGFSVYLPTESLTLARKALEQTSSPPGSADTLGLHLGGANTHAYVRSCIPGLLKPIAKWHDGHRHEALELRWRLRLEMPTGILHANRNHPWEVIA
ncbi:MAG: hypothetical protein WC378_20260, partial [Opitutaceae bacterium]